MTYILLECWFWRNDTFVWYSSSFHKDCYVQGNKNAIFREIVEISDKLYTQGTIVAVKHLAINKPKVELTRTMLLEMKKVLFIVISKMLSLKTVNLF